MDKKSAILEVNYRGVGAPVTEDDTHFANVNGRKRVWWIDIPVRELLDVSSPAINLLLAENGAVHHLRVPKGWMTDHMEGFALRTDRDAVSLELSVDEPKF